MYTTAVLIIGITSFALAHSKVEPEISCSSTSLDVRVSRENVEKVTLEKWSQLPGCQTQVERDFFVISLKLNSDLPCGTTRIRNKITGQTLFYHQLQIIETGGSKHLYKISCFLSPDDGERSNIVKRNVLPAEFMEPDFIEMTSEVSGTAPIPELSVGVRQSGNLIGDKITVSPGSPLTMEVYLDSTSASIYGILVSYMMVSDTTEKNETIIYNGCTQDRYVFENFQTIDGDFLTAKFRAFKFPESNYLLFRGTVDVCLDKCEGIRCSNGEVGFGRKRRALPHDSADPNRIFEVTMMTFVKVGEEEIVEKETSLMGLQKSVSKSEEPTVSFREEEILISRRSHDDQPPFMIFARNAAVSLNLPFSLSLVASILISLVVVNRW